MTPYEFACARLIAAAEVYLETAKYQHLTHPELLAFLDDFKMNHGCSKGNY